MDAQALADLGMLVGAVVVADQMDLAPSVSVAFD
jgi:hypothetical protein